jgi:ABC-type multidrug transport system fused ATPase/permease subunit
LSLLSKRERKQLVIVMICSVILAIIEVIGVGSIMPFVAVASQPSIIQTNAAFAMVYDFFRFESTQSFLLALGILMLFFVLFRNLGQLALQYIKYRFTSMRRHSLSFKLFKGYLSQKYLYFLNKNSSDFVKNINNEIEQMINGTLMQLVDATSYSIQVLLLICFLFVINPFSTLCIAAAIVVIYGLIYFFIRKTLKRLGTARFEYNLERNRITSEAFWGIKEVKLTGVERVFLESYSVPSKGLARNYYITETISDVPKYVLESVAFGSIVLFILFMVMQSGNFQSAAATVSLYAYAGYRLMPAVQSLFRSISKLKYSAPASQRMENEFANAKIDSSITDTTPSRMPFEKGISIEGITFTYPGCDKPVLGNVHLSIPVNSLIGFAGKTGSGKTTLVDVFMGLLAPQSGTITVDGVPITENNVRSWQQNIGYVPQNIYLSNDSIAKNIAFGVTEADIDRQKVRDAARLAQIDEFIETELKDGYDTAIGERGIKLSGGQRQRIGIARALYRNPPILVMDEATSALDSQTEQAVMDAIDGLSGKKTIILIAHRVTTLRKCDIIFRLEKGKIVEQGTFDTIFKEK